MQNKPLSLAVATLLKIGQKHKAATNFSLTSLVDEMEQEFTGGEFELSCGIRGLKYVSFPCEEAHEIALQLLENKLIPDYALEDKGDIYNDNYIAKYSVFDTSQAQELNRELQKLVKDTEKDTKSIIEAADICDSEDAKLLNAVVAASAKDIVSGRERDEVESKVKNILFEILDIEEPSSSDRLVEDLGADSLDEMEILMAIEEDFEIILPEAQIEHVKTVGQIVDYLMDEKRHIKSEEQYDNMLAAGSSIKKVQSNKELSVGLIMKYLKNKGGRATLKQIQSRFKGYLDNTCGQIKDLVSRETNWILVFSGKLSQCEVVLSENWNEGV